MVYVNDSLQFPVHSHYFLLIYLCTPINHGILLFKLKQLFILRATGFLLPCYIMVRALSIIQRRRQRHATMAAAEMALRLQGQTDVANHEHVINVQ